ncbi:MAG: hypothetical protein M5U22_17930 [Thermoleophilia bacterium]|nr:hypothetical protein [Thermoleophilia bacterium]
MMSRSNTWLVVLLVVVVALLVGFGAFQAGLHAGAGGDFWPRDRVDPGYGYHGWTGPREAGGRVGGSSCAAPRSSSP